MHQITELKNLWKKKTDGEINKCTTIVGDFNTLFSVIDRKTRQKISKDIEVNNAINQQDLIDIY